MARAGKITGAGLFTVSRKRRVQRLRLEPSFARGADTHGSVIQKCPVRSRRTLPASGPALSSTARAHQA
jgi:hypothetical protein